MADLLSNTALANTTFDEWRINTNLLTDRVNQFFVNANTVNAANSVTTNTLNATGTSTLSGPVTLSGVTVSVAANTTFSSANTNIFGNRLLITANTNINATNVLINGVPPGTDDNALAFAIALG